MIPKIIVVNVAHDQEARVWLVESSDLPGLFLEGETPEALTDKFRGAILDLFESGGYVDAGLGLSTIGAK